MRFISASTCRGCLRKARNGRCRGCRASCQTSFRSPAAHPERTVFTRFIPAQKPGQGAGMWRRYYERWGSMTIDQLGPEMVGPGAGSRPVRPARPHLRQARLLALDRERASRAASRGDVETVIITGGETDVCVLATVLARSTGASASFSSPMRCAARQTKRMIP